MKILFICDEYPPGKIGGIGTAVHLLAKELAEMGHRVFVAGLYPYSYGGPDHERAQGVEIWRLRYGYDFKGNEFLDKLYRRLPGWLRGRFNVKKAFLDFTTFISSLIKKEKIDVVEIADWNTFALYAGFHVDWPRFSAPLVLKSHGSHTYFADETKEKSRRFMKRIDQALFSRADAHSAVSAYTAEKNRKLFALNKPVRVLFNAVEPVKRSSLIKRKKEQVLFAGSLVEKKGIFQLMKAWNLVNERAPGLQLIVAGKGKQHPLKALLQKGASQSVTFTGHISREKLLELFEESSIAALPSYSETFGLVAIEAMIMGCAVIFTRRSCGPEIVQDNETGLLVEPDDPADIADAIIRLYENNALREQLVANAEKKVKEKFDIRNSARDHIAFYEEVIAEFKTKKNLV